MTQEYVYKIALRLITIIGLPLLGALGTTLAVTYPEVYSAVCAGR